MEIIGLRCRRTFEEASEYFLSAGAEVVLMDASRVFGRDHVLSAMMHAERAFENGTSRSRTLITEFLVYMAGERQISKALEIMRPKDENMVAVFISGFREDIVSGIGDICGQLIDGTEDKAKRMGLDKKGMDISYDDMVLEMTAMVDILKI